MHDDKSLQLPISQLRTQKRRHFPALCARVQGDSGPTNVAKIRSVLQHVQQRAREAGAELMVPSAMMETQEAAPTPVPVKK